MHDNGVSLNSVKPQMRAHLPSLAVNVGRSVLDALTPPLCPVSGAPMGAAGLLSASAWAALHFIEEPFCSLCGVPFSAEYGAEVLCPSCIAAPPAFDAARAAVVYNDASHKLIVGFKHSDRTELAPLFAQWLARAGEGLLSRSAILVPVPLHFRRLFSRRYNQSAVLTNALAKRTGARAGLEVLRRVRATPPQKNLSADARRRNVAGAFTINQKPGAHIDGAHIVLIDDVLTTGATLSACARVLKKAGAARVDALVLARVVKGGVGAI